MLTFRGVDLQTATIHLDLAQGFSEPPDVRGEDDVVPRAAGRVAGARRADMRRIILNGHVRGTGTTREERALSWRTATDALMAAMDRTLDPGVLEVGPTAPAQQPDAASYLGLTTDYAINARCVNLIPGPVQAHMSYQTWSIELVSIDSPPDWVAGS